MKYVQFDPATGNIYGWGESMEVPSGPGVLLDAEPPDPPEHYRVTSGRIEMKTPAEIAAVMEDAAQRAGNEAISRMRRIRNRLLTESDWTQMPDAPLDDETRAAWAVYRQALRDIPQTTDEPDDVIWPAQPT